MRQNGITVDPALSQEDCRYIEHNLSQTQT